VVALTYFTMRSLVRPRLLSAPRRGVAFCERELGERTIGKLCNINTRDPKNQKGLVSLLLLLWGRELARK
jgi:hypothetical protein